MRNLNEKYKNIFVIKFGGSLMSESIYVEGLLRDVAFLHSLGIQIVLVHGGGEDISTLSKKLNLTHEFINGQRVTCASTMEVVEMVLRGKINGKLVSLMNKYGVKSIGVSGRDCSFIKVTEQDKNLGLVGKITSIESPFLEDLLSHNYLVIVSPIGVNEKEDAYNINADFVAGEIAAHLQADELIIMSDVNGIFEDIKRVESRIEYLNLESLKKLSNEKKISAGMLPKIDACMGALEKGVKNTCILNGKMEKSLLLKILQKQNIGTTIMQ